MLGCAMTTMLGPDLHFLGSRPSSPGPRVMIGRMYLSLAALFCIAFTRKSLVWHLRASRSAARFSRESFSQTHVEIASLLRHVVGKGRDVRLRFPRGPCVPQGLVVPDLATVLPDELLAEF